VVRAARTKTKPGQTFPIARRGVDLAERTGDVSEVAIAYGVLGRAHWARGEYDAAVTVFQKCLEIEASEPPRGMSAMIAIPSVVSARWLAQSLAELGSFEAATTIGRKALHTAETRDHGWSNQGMRRRAVTSRAGRAQGPASGPRVARRSASSSAR
jgi:tetratricopeptide (TPR) repeat protein